jgi:DNA (cytosine-5)-methyltransferase 1
VFDAELPSEPKAVIGFAGGGGSSAAYKAATGRDPDAALNHWILAVLAHQRNHPATEHHCADIFEADPRTILPGAHLHFGWFSPDCTDHSKAKGTAPKSERIRGLGWAILPWARLRRPDVIIIENVEEWAQWGPVYRCPDDWRAAGVPGKVGEPIKALRGETFRRLIKRFRRSAYEHIGWRELVSADYGGWTTRKRLFVVLSLRPFVWPKRTHAPRHLAEKLGLKPWRGAWEKIDFSLPCPSIFLTPNEARELKRATGVSCKRPLARNTMRRAARGYERYVAGAAEPFVVRITRSASGDGRVTSAAEPIGTFTTSKGGEFAIAQPFIAPVTHGGDARVHSLADPLRTGLGKGDKALVVPTVMRTDMHKSNAGCVYDPADPLRCPTSTGGFAISSAYLVPRYGERPGQDPRCRSVLDPAPTPVPDGNGGSLAACSLVRQFGTSSAADIREPVGTVMPDGQGKTQLLAASLQTYYRTGDGSDLADPVRVATAKDRHGLSACFLEQANTDMVGHACDEPLSTIVGKGCTQRLIEARLSQEGGEVGRRGRVLAFLWEHFGEPTAADWADPTGTLQARLRFGIVLLAGEPWMVVDIGLRMLKARELAGCMGMPDGFRLDEDVHGRPISHTAQVEMIGNMVERKVAEALIRAVAPEICTPPEMEDAA